MESGTLTRLSSLVKEPLFEELELKLKNPNLFYILRLEDFEIRHSNFLAWLLNPQGNHQLGDLFLKHVLKDLFSNRAFKWINEFEVDQLDLGDVDVKREWQNIDILIVSKRFVICIENKFGSSEHSGQLHRYKVKLEENFPKHNHVFVYLTPYGATPLSKEDQELYMIYTYSDISERLQTIIDVYNEHIPSRVMLYLKDYITVIKRRIMKEDELNILARKIYESHKEALDFIFDNKPDRLAEVDVIFREFVKKEGWILGTKSKGLTRFLSPRLNEIIPRSGIYGWKNKESFLFEFDYWPKNINFKTVISPGNDNHREMLSKLLSSIEGSIKPRGSQWLTHFNLKWSYDVTNLKYSNEDIAKKLTSIWPDIKDLVVKMEQTLLGVQDQLKQT